MKAPRSVFWKLLIALAVFAVAINLIVWVSFRLFFAPNMALRETAHRNLAQYAEFLVDELGAPPSLEKAKEIEQRLGISIRVEGPSEAWATSEGLPAIDELETNPRWNKRHEAREHRALGHAWGHANGRLHLIVSRGEYRYALYTPDGSSFGPRWEAIALLLVLLTAIVAGLFLVLRRILRPVHSLRQGVQAIAGGNLAYRVDVATHDEFGALATSFNQMTEQIQAMLQAREQLLLDVSHEFRSPLTRMKVALEFLPEDKNRQRLAEDIRELEAMVTDILETARLDQPGALLRRESFDLSPLVEEVAGRYAGAPGITTDITAGIHYNGDSTRIRTVVGNLLDNALKYSGESEHAVSVSLRREDDTVVLAVRDHGPGVPPEELPRLVEPYYRVDKSRTKATGGYGLGLSLCKKIVEAHGGTFTLTLPDGGGLMAEVRLPG